MGRAQEPGGDYEYDLAHQDLPAEIQRDAPRPGDLPAPTGPAPDSAGDYAYDEAHDF